MNGDEREILKLKNVRYYVLLSAFYGSWFVEAVWFFYWARFASYTQIGIMFSVLTIVRILSEVPTGVFADRFGRKLSINIGALSMLTGSVLIFSAQSLYWLFIGGLFEDIGRSFISGADQALVYDDLKSRNKHNHFNFIVSYKIRISIIVFAVTVMVGGFLYKVYFRLPNILMTLSYLGAFITSLLMSEKAVPKVVRTIKEHISDNVEGFRQLFKPVLKPILFPCLLSIVIFFQYDWGFSKPAMAVNFGFYERGQSFIYAFFAVINAYFVTRSPFIRKMVGDFKGLVLLNLVMGLGFFFASFKLGYLGIITMVVIEVAGVLSEPWMSTIINDRISSTFRATTLSTLQMLGKLPFLLLNLKQVLFVPVLYPI